MSISTTELCIKTENMKNVPVQSTPLLKVALGNEINVYLYHLIIYPETLKYNNKAENICDQGPENISYTTFVEKGWKQETSDELPVNSKLDAKYIQLYPETVRASFLYKL